MHAFVTIVENEMDVNAWVYFWVLYYTSLAYVSILMPTICCLCYFTSVAYFEIKYGDSSRFVVFDQHCLGYSGYLMLPYEF
jgi:hypothetical protein